MAASLRHLGTRTCVRSPNNMAFVAIKMDRRQGALEQFCFESQLIDPQRPDRSRAICQTGYYSIRMLLWV
jgi:hypothetical protein